MIIRSITLKNFLSYGSKSQKIDFCNKKLICLSGNNGHGKSALLEAITWGLWGMARRPQGKNKSDTQVMRIGSKDMSVAVEVLCKNNRYIIHRSCQRSGQKAMVTLSLFSLTSDGSEISLTTDSLKETQELIHSILGVTYDLFINTSFLRQGLSNEFTKKTPQERKDLLVSLLNIGHIEELREKIGISYRKIEQKYTILREVQKITIPSSEIKEMQGEETEESITEKKKIYEEEKNLLNLINMQIEENSILQKKLQLQWLELQEDAYKFRNEQSLLQKKSFDEIAELKKVKTHSKIFCKKWQKIANGKFSLLTMEKKITQIKKRKILFQHYIAQKEQELKITQEWEKKITDFLKNIIEKSNCQARCIICSSALSRDKPIHLSTQIEKRSIEKIQEIKKKIKKAELLFIRLSSTSPLLDEILHHTTSLLKKNHQSYQSMRKTTATIIKKKIDLTYSEQSLFAQIHSLKKEIEKSSSEKILLEEKKKKINIILTQKYENFIRAEHIFKKMIEEKIEREKKQKDYEEQALKEEERLQRYRELIAILGKDGIQSLIIEESIPIIEYEANTILQKISPNGSTISLFSSKELQDGRSKDTLDIIISDGYGIRPYEFFSGGEAFRIDLALRIGLAKTLARRTGITIKTFIIDEGFGSQDSDSLDLIVQTLHSLQSEFELIIVVSHLTPLKDQFPLHITVHKGQLGSIATY